MERRYDELLREGFAPLHEEWRSRSLLLGRRVKIIAQQREVEGRAMDIDEHGALVVRHDTGLQERFTAGDVVKLW